MVQEKAVRGEGEVQVDGTAASWRPESRAGLRQLGVGYELCSGRLQSNDYRDHSQLAHVFV